MYACAPLTVPSDFPLPIFAPEITGFVDCTTVRLRLPVLRYCYAATKMALQYSRGEAGGKWTIMRHDVLGGELEVCMRPAVVAASNTHGGAVVVVAEAVTVLMVMAEAVRLLKPPPLLPLLPCCRCCRSHCRC